MYRSIRRRSALIAKQLRKVEFRLISPLTMAVIFWQDCPIGLSIHRTIAEFGLNLEYIIITQRSAHADWVSVILLHHDHCYRKPNM